MTQGFLRVAACSPLVHVADPAANRDEITALMRRAADEGADLAVFPELCVTGYTCADLFHQHTLLAAAARAVGDIAREMPAELPMAVIGAPVEYCGALYNCAIFVSRGRVHAAVPKTYLPAYNEFYEKRWFAPAPDGTVTVNIGDTQLPMGQGLGVEVAGVPVAAEICEDLWAPAPPSVQLAMGGALVVANLSASDDLIGKYSYLRSLVLQQSARCLCGYVYASAGFGESSTDLVFDAKDFVAENGRMLATGPRWSRESRLTIADIDTEGLRRERMHTGTWHDCAARNAARPLDIVASVAEVSCDSARGLLRAVDPTPFVPTDDERLAERCEEIIHIQSTGLSRRLTAAHCRSLTVGISGGLDSTLALLVAVRAFDSLGLDRNNIIGVTMPGFGTTGRTHTNAVRMMQALGVSIREVSIVAAVRQHFADIGHNPEVHDVTYENSQARERTQILMDIANQTGGMVLGTGDLSELALGWATYNGDHMSMYGINAGVPKTLVRHLVRYFAERVPGCEGAREALLDVIDTPVSPELLPADAQGNIAQKTEDLVGPYELHDFFLYHMLRHGESPRRIFALARTAWGKVYDDATIARWLRTFVRRFFAQQFKRSCLPDGPKVGSVTLSPRGDWRMPSDADAAAWLRECDELPH